MTRSVKIIVSGRVQGVYFRLFTRNKAKQLGVGGHAMNLPDGRVEILAHATPENIEKLIRWCHKGPVTARVDHVEWFELDLEAHEIPVVFEIK
ncbi:MAG: acylphosphatase [Methylococcales bacterium]|nr:acylphosphatase [Methylococcales bacterium]